MQRFKDNIAPGMAIKSAGGSGEKYVFTWGRNLIPIEGRCAGTACGKMPKSAARKPCRGAVSSVALRRFQRPYGTAEAVPLQNPSRRFWSFSASCEAVPFQNSRRQEFFRRLCSAAANQNRVFLRSGKLLNTPREAFRILGQIRSLRRFLRFLAGRFRAFPRTRDLADSRIPGNDKVAGEQRRLFEIRRIGGKDLPACHFFPQHLNGSHVREIAAQALMVFLGSGEPDSVVRGFIRLVAKDEDNLVLNIDGQAAEHRPGHGGQGSNRVEHELMRDRFTRLAAEKWSVQRGRDRIAARPGHRSYDIARLR